MDTQIDGQMVEQVRRFNRLVTQRAGALDDHYLARGRALGASRVLWEIGSGCEIRQLRARLGLDSGYLSRILRSLEADGLVATGSSDNDARVRTVRLTSAGRHERALLDRRSDRLAESVLGSLAPDQRERLVTAMHDVERLLTAATVEIDVVDPEDPRAQHCLRSYFGELDERFRAGFDPRATRGTDPSEWRAPAGRFLMATLWDEPVGCGAVRFHDDVAEIKRMWVAPHARGLGLGRRLLTELESAAADGGATTVRLDTNKALVEAIAMYLATGYVEIDDYNGEPYADHWFEKRLGGPSDR
ncbi:MAG TPA: MarR family winged helix-turn-helix transcriptional regulator [Ilumatobacteraceae bacterium]